MSARRICQSFIYNNPYKGLPTVTNFKIREENLPPLKENEYLVEAVYISIAPSAAASQMKLHTVPKAFQLARIIESRNKDFSVGEHVIGNFGWQTHTIINSSLNEEAYVTPEATTLSMGLLGMPGIAAYFGLFNICKPCANDVVVVSSAAGAIGSCVGQLAKIQGCKVIGLAGSDEKCRWLIDLGFDNCINYKTDNIKSKLEEYAPNGVDCYFDNVGGEISSAVIYQLRKHGRICICGATALYYDNMKVPEIQSPIKINVAKMEGMQITRWRNEWNVAIQQISQWLNENKLKCKETIINDFKNVPQVFIDVLNGKYFGSVVVSV